VARRAPEAAVEIRARKEAMNLVLSVLSAKPSCSASEARCIRYSGNPAQRFVPHSKATWSWRRLAVTLPLPVVTGTTPDQLMHER
jgi:hypothetical protein